MEIEKRIKDVLVKKYEELQGYSNAFNSRAKKQREDIMLKHKEAFQKDPTSVDVKDIARNMFYINGFMQLDVRKLQTQLLDLYNFSKEIYPELELPEALVDTVTVLKESLQKQTFVEDSGELVEIEKGKVEKLLKDFDNKNYFNLFEAQVKTLLDA